MVLDPIPPSLPVHFFGSRPQPPTSHPTYVAVTCYVSCCHVWLMCECISLWICTSRICGCISVCISLLHLMHVAVTCYVSCCNVICVCARVSVWICTSSIMSVSLYVFRSCISCTLLSRVMYVAVKSWVCVWVCLYEYTHPVTSCVHVSLYTCRC